MSTLSADWALLLPPFVAGLLVLATHVPLGIEVLRRGIIFIDLAIAQIAALGVLAAGLLGIEESLGTAGVQFAAALAALSGAAVLTWTERRWPEIQEALIGLLFVFGAAAGILLLAGNPHGGEHLRDLLAGQLLWVSWDQLVSVAGLYAVIFLFRKFASPGMAAVAPRFGFYAVFAIVVTASVQLVGVLLVFASLIAPAVATTAMTGIRRHLAAFALGALAYGLGLLLSLQADLPAGAAVVCALVGLAFGGIVVLRK